LRKLDGANFGTGFHISVIIHLIVDKNDLNEK